METGIAGVVIFVIVIVVILILISWFAPSSDKNQGKVKNFDDDKQKITGKENIF